MTAAADTFTRADSTTTLGVTEVGGLTWAVAAAIGVPPWGIASNKARAIGSTPTNHWATVDVGESDGTVEVTVTSGEQGGAIFRYVDGNNFLMVSSSPTGVGSPLTRLLRIQSGTVTALASVAAAASGDVVSAHFEGSTIRAYRNGVQIGSDVTSSFNVTATKMGMHCFTNTARLDDWSFTPIPDVSGWPLWFKTADGRDFRIGPDNNPDGGICYFVGADGTAWVQDPAGAPVHFVGADGAIKTTLPMIPA